LEVGHHLGGEQFDGPHNLIVWQPGEAEIAKDVIDTRGLGLFDPLDDNLGSSPEWWKSCMAKVISAFPVVLTVGPMLITGRDVAVLVGGHTYSTVGSFGPQNSGGEIFETDWVILRFVHRWGDVDTLGHRRVKMGMGVAILIHLLPPELDDLWCLAHDVGGSAGDYLYLATGGEFYAGWAGANSLKEWRIRFLQRLGQDQQVVNVGEFAVVRQPFFGPGFYDYVDRLSKTLTALIDIDSDTVELLPLVTSADTEVETPTADDI